MNKKSVIIFDFDGTLADTTLLVQNSILGTLREYGHFEVDENNLEDHFGPSEPGIIKKIVGDKVFPEAWAYFLEEYIRIQKETIKRIPGMDDLLENLSKRKDLLLLLITGRCRETAEISLSYLGYESYFGKVYTGSEEGINKDVSIETALNDFGIQKENIVYIGDTLADIHTMRKAQVDLLSVSYCYQDEMKISQLEKENAGNVMHSVMDLQKRLDEITK